MYLHRNNWYHLNLHSGNILIDKDRVKITELENYIVGHVPRNEHFFNFIIESFINENKLGVTKN